MTSQPKDRRRYRFRAWHKLEKELYPVVAVVRGGVILQDKIRERTCSRSDVDLMQYSGVNDVTGNGIYEGDILEVTNGSGKKVMRVILDDGAFQLQPMQGDDASMVLQQEVINNHKAGIISNVYKYKSS